MCKQPSSKWMQNAQTVAWQAPQPTTEGREQPVILSIHAAVSASQRAAAAFGDVDQDGDFDLLLGDSYGRLNFFENIGNRTNHKFVYVDRHTRPVYPMCANATLPEAPTALDFSIDPKSLTRNPNAKFEGLRHQQPLENEATRHDQPHLG